MDSAVKNCNSNTPEHTGLIHGSIGHLRRRVCTGCISRVKQWKIQRSQWVTELSRLLNPNGLVDRSHKCIFPSQTNVLYAKALTCHQGQSPQNTPKKPRLSFSGYSSESFNCSNCNGLAWPPLSCLVSWDQLQTDCDLVLDKQLWKMFIWVIRLTHAIYSI